MLADKTSINCMEMDSQNIKKHNKTPLWQQHQQLGAKFVDFAGYDMPVSYTSQIVEHLAVREDAGVFDISHMAVIDIHGVDAGKFLAYLLPNDITNLANNKALYSCMCNHDGGIIDDLIVYKLSEDTYRTIVNASTWQKDLKWLTENSSEFKVQINKLEDIAILAVQGPNARSKLINILEDILENNKLDFNLECDLNLIKNLKPFECSNNKNFFIARTGYTGEDGFELVLPASIVEKFWRLLLEYNISACGLGARDTLRLEAGMMLYGQDMTEDNTPYESGLGWTVKFSNNRNFIGRKKLEQQLEQQIESKNSQQILIIGLVLQDKGVLRTGQEVNIYTDGDNSLIGKGIVTSGTYSPSIKNSIALARITVDKNKLDDKLLNKTCKVNIRNKLLSAEIVKFPFVRANKVVYKKII